MINVSWHDEDNGILLWMYPPDWTLAMYDDAFKHSQKLVQNHTGRLDVIEDHQATTVIPRKYIRNVLDKHEELDAKDIQLGIIVILTDKPKMQFIAQMINALPNVNRRLHVVATMDEALSLIQNARDTNHMS